MAVSEKDFWVQKIQNKLGAVVTYPERERKILADIDAAVWYRRHGQLQEYKMQANLMEWGAMQPLIWTRYGTLKKKS